MIGEHLQFHTISNSFIHYSQLGGLKQRSTTDTGVVLTYIIHSGWIENLIMSTLAFDITQFFPSLNHQLLFLILDKMGLDQKVSNFFKNYLVGTKTSYCWNNFISPSFDINIGIGQGSVLLPILSTLYLFPIFHSLEKCLKILKIPISMISFVDNGLFISQNKSISYLNANLFCSYNVISFFFWNMVLLLNMGKLTFFTSLDHMGHLILLLLTFLLLEVLCSSLKKSGNIWASFLTANPYLEIISISIATKWFLLPMYEVAQQFIKKYQPSSKKKTL